MTCISNIQMFEQPEQPVLAIRETIHFNNFPETASRAYDKIAVYAAQHGLLFSGGPYVCYHNTNLERLDVEMGFPLARAVPGNGDILGYSIPSQKVAAGIFLGAYEETDPLMLEIMQWITEHGHQQKGPIFNYYLNEATRPTNELLTQIVIPIK